MEANEYNFVCFTINGINPWSQITPMFAHVHHSDGGRTDPFSIAADWTTKCSIKQLEFINDVIILKWISDHPTVEKEAQVKPKSK